MLKVQEIAPRPGTLDEFKRLTAKKLEALRCPEHHQRPRLRFRGSSLKNVDVELSACCADLIMMANRAIAEIN